MKTKRISVLVVLSLAGWLLPLTGKGAEKPAEARPVAVPAEIVVPSEGSGKQSQVEVRFGSPMVQAGMAGQTVEIGEVLEVKPALGGKFRWQSTRSGSFEAEGVIPLGIERSLTLRKGLKDLQGNRAEAAGVKVAGSPLELKETSPRWFYPGSEAGRQPEVTLYFNDAVNPEAVVRETAFFSRDGTRVAVTGWTPKVGELGKNPPDIGTWEEQSGGRGEPVSDAEAVSVVRIKPVRDLPLGENWVCRIGRLVNASGRARLAAQREVVYGTIGPLAVNRVSAVPVLDGMRELQVAFTKKPAELSVAEWSDAVRISPRPDVLAWAVTGQILTVTGSFAQGQEYAVTMAAGLKALDGTQLPEPINRIVVFAPHEPQLSLPAFDHAQWIGGKGEFAISTANLARLRVKIKKAAPETVAFLLNGYAAYEYDEDHPDSSGAVRLPWAVVPGNPVWEKTFPTAVELDRSERFGFRWDELQGEKRTPGIYFVSVEGDPREDARSHRTLGAQAVVQLSDIGLAWKYAGRELLVYLFSHTTGKPMTGVPLRGYSKESEVRAEAVSSEDGMARLPMEDLRWVVADAAGDLRGVRVDGGQSEINRWAYDLPVDDAGERGPSRELMLFTERPVYQPGETVFFKAITRLHEAVTLTIPEERKAKLTLLDPQRRAVLNRDIEFTASGSFADALRLPAEGLGWYTLRIAFPGPEAAAEPDGESGGEAEEGEDGGSYRRRMVFEQMVLVQEYQPNAFRIAFDDGAVAAEGELRKVPLKAAYLMGKALGAAQLTWSSRLSQASFRPGAFEDYRFCNARSYYVYDGESYQSMKEEAALTPLLTGQGTMKLSDHGEAVIEAAVPSTFGVPGPRLVSISAEITDLNQQTIAEEWQRTEHSSDFYIGVRRAANAVKAGVAVPISLVAVDTDGRRLAVPVKAGVLTEHLIWNGVRVQTAGGGTEIRNELSFKKTGAEEVTISPESGMEEAWTFRPQTAGTHNLTFSAVDGTGRTVRTVVSIDVYAPDAVVWQQEEGVQTELLPDKEEYQPGETARIVVKSPFSGTALVTVERERVLYAGLREVQAGGAVELKVDESWAPNAFVSVMQVRGGAEDPRAHPEPDYRLGYAQIRVASLKNRLSVELLPAQPEVRPGGLVEVTTMVRDASGQPVPDAELAVWAVDEGILSLMPWEVPDPSDTFHYDAGLGVRTGISLQRLLPENPENLEFTNKGFVIGGGGEMDGGGKLMRKDFKPTAYWHGMLRTGVDGTVKVQFPAPDNLTEFRLAAVACEGTSRFGRGEGRFKVNQPLMLEPALPRFANVGDEITLKAVLHNTTETGGEISVELAADDPVSLLDPESRKPLGSHSLTRTVTLKAQESRAVAFPVRFLTNGPVVLRWKASCAGQPLLADAVESKFDVGFAEPLLREVNFMSLTSQGNGQDLLAAVRPELLEGTNGRVAVTLANSRVLEGGEAVLRLLHYPYGCAEQTMSSMLPWLTLRDMKKVLPDLNRPDEEIADVIQRGCDRLLSMQTASGGLAYWPGGESPSLWASSHGTLGLVMASRSGADVPENRLASLTKWLSASLREAGGLDAWGLTERCYASYALALAGKSEPGYHELLFAERNELPRSARALLALAIAESDGPAEMAHTVLAVQRPEDKNDGWWGSASAQAMRVMALLKLKDPGADAEMGRLLASRSPRGDWANTLSNAWVLMALGREAAQAPLWQGNQPAVLELDGASQEISLPAEPASRNLELTFQSGETLPRLTATLPEGQKLFARVEVSSRAKPGPQAARQAGFGITRQWQRLGPDGTPPAEAGPLRTGDLVLVSLKIELPAAAEYLVIDDPLPATMEAVNPNFTSMAAAPAVGVVAQTWFSDYTEMRRDRVLFFRDWFSGQGTFGLSYLARVVAEGSVTVPAARIEMMYDPSRFGLSSSERLTTESSPDDSVAVR